MEFTLQPATVADAAFLYALHGAAMRAVIEATWGWDEAWQRADFAAHFVPERINLIVCEGTPVGMVELEDRPNELYLANLKLLPAWQRRGLGTRVVQQLLARAATDGAPVTLQVLQANTEARLFYERLGFRESGVVPPHVQMLLTTRRS